MSLLSLFLQHPSISKDTRTVREGDMYFALRGGNFDGNAFAADALARGAAYAIVDNPAVCVAADTRYILVPDALIALQTLATEYRRQFSSPVLGITGSNGKTTSKELINSVLSTHFRAHATKGNLNNHIGVPLTLLSMPLDTEIAIIEMGANKPGDIEELVEIAEPTAGLITNIGKAHLEQLGGIEGVRRTKAALFRFVKAHGGEIFVNTTDAHVVAEAAGIPQHTFGATEGAFTYRLLSSSLTEMHVEVRHAAWASPEIFVSQLTGAYNCLNIVAAVAVGVAFGVPLEKIKAGIAAYRPENARSQLIERNGVRIWMDAYNANPSSMRASIQGIFDLLKNEKTIDPRVVLVLGDMFELGEHAEAEHRELGEFVADFQPDLTVCVGPLMRFAYEALPENARLWYENAAAAKSHWQEITHGASLVLLKGSRGIALEQILS